MRLDDLLSERTHATPSSRSASAGVFVLAIILLIIGITAWSQVWARVFDAAVRGL